MGERFLLRAALMTLVFCTTSTARSLPLTTRIAASPETVERITFDLTSSALVRSLTPRGPIVPALASAMEFDPEKKVLRLRLAKAIFQNGERVQLRDVVYSLERCRPGTTLRERGGWLIFSPAGPELLKELTACPIVEEETGRAMAEHDGIVSVADWVVGKRMPEKVILYDTASIVAGTAPRSVVIERVGDEERQKRFREGAVDVLAEEPVGGSSSMQCGSYAVTFRDDSLRELFAGRCVVFPAVMPK